MTRKCGICGTRSIGTGPGHDAANARIMGYCNPCMTEVDWENAHSGYGHDDPDCVAKGYDTQDQLDECWKCHPELNPGNAPRTGTSREDQTRTIPRSHAACQHDRTPKARAACRKSGGPKV